MEKIGIELGIRTPLNTIKKAAKIAEDSNKIDYFLVPKTHPKFIGVDAFQTLENLSKDVHKIRIGTGIVNIFSRSENEILNKSEKIFRQTNGNFILGLGTSTPYIVGASPDCESWGVRIDWFLGQESLRYTEPIVHWRNMP